MFFFIFFPWIIAHFETLLLSDAQIPTPGNPGSTTRHRLHVSTRPVRISRNWHWIHQACGFLVKLFQTLMVPCDWGSQTLVERASEPYKIGFWECDSQTHMTTIKMYSSRSIRTYQLIKTCHGRLFRVQLSILESAMEAFGSWPIQINNKSTVVSGILRWHSSSFWSCCNWGFGSKRNRTRCSEVLGGALKLPSQKQTRISTMDNFSCATL